MYSLSRITNSTESKDNLNIIFNPENEISCSIYGGGTHCNEEKVATKVRVWGGRNVDEDSCARPNFILTTEGVPVGISVIGFTGSKPTVTDNRTENKGSVYELSGLFIRDKFLNDLDAIAKTTKNFMQTCKADSSYTKAIISFNPSHPYQSELLLAAGAIKITSENLNSEFGENSFHPERFRFSETGQSQECSKWASIEKGEVHHEGWHACEPCIQWSDKTILAFDVTSGNIIVGNDEL